MSRSATREVQITFDCADPGLLAAFWAEAMGYLVQPPPAGFATWDDALAAWGVPAEERNPRSACVPPEAAGGPRMFFQRVPEPRTVKNRVHLDIRAAPGLDGEDRMAALAAEADRLVAAGATVLRRVEPTPPMEAGFVVTADPEGNEFCLD